MKSIKKISLIPAPSEAFTNRGTLTSLSSTRSSRKIPGPYINEFTTAIRLGD